MSVSSEYSDSDEWYVLKNNQQIGPLTFDLLAEFAEKQAIQPTDYVWRPDWPDWKPLSAVLSLPSPRPRQSHERFLSATRDTDGLQPSGERGNYFIRHWRGDLSLTVAYWINFVLPNVLIVGVIGFLTYRTGKPKDLSLVLIVALLQIIFVALLFMWQATGVWRSAANHPKRGGRPIWALLAKAAVIVGLIIFTAAIASSSYPALRGLVKLAFIKGPSCPALNLSHVLAAPPSKRVTFTLAMKPQPRRDQLTYAWSISSGQIVIGQGTPAIAVEAPSGFVTATIQVGGLTPPCRGFASDSAKIP